MRTEGEWRAIEEKDAWGRPVWNVMEAERDIIILYHTQEATAQHIVKCVNCHEELTALAREYRNLIEGADEMDLATMLGTHYYNQKRDMIDRIDAVMEKAAHPERSGADNE